MGNGSRQESPVEHISLFAPAVLRRLLIAFVIAASVPSAIVVSLYLQDARHQREILEQEGHYLIALEREFLSLEFGAVQSDLLYLAQQGALKRFLSGDHAARGMLEREYAKFAVNKAVYDQIRCLDAAGKEIIRVNYVNRHAHVVPFDELQTKAGRYYYEQAMLLDEGQVFVSPFDLNIEHDQIERPIKPVIRFLTPVSDESGAKRGLLVLNYLGAHLLARLKEVSARIPGQAMVINPAGEYLLAPNRNQEWGWLLGHKHAFRSDFPGAWQRCQRVQRGQFYVGHDLFTFERISPAKRRQSAADSGGVSEVQQSNSITLVSYVPASVATSYSANLLKQLLLMYAGTIALVFVLSLYWARSGAIREHQKRQLADSESRLRQLSTRLLASQEAERRSISRDLHDELGQQVTAISLDLKSAARADVGPRAGPLLQRAIDETEQLLKSVHEIATRLRPSVLDDLGLHDAVESLAAEYEQRTDISVLCDLCFHQRAVPPIVGENVYRILQEALANVASHAQTPEVSVRIEVDDKTLCMVVRDKGVGFAPKSPSSRLGIIGMQERVELLHGYFELRSAPGEGTQIRITIPLPS